MTKPATPLYPHRRIVLPSDLTPDDIERMTAPLPPGPDEYNLADLDDDGKLVGSTLMKSIRVGHTLSQRVPEKIDGLAYIRDVAAGRK